MNKDQFLERLKELYSINVEISKKKNSDYATEDDPFKNFKLCEFIGTCSVEAGIITRIGDKITRVSQLLKKEADVNDENIYDTLSDLSNYAMILRIYLETKIR